MLMVCFANNTDGRKGIFSFVHKHKRIHFFPQEISSTIIIIYLNWTQVEVPTVCLLLVFFFGVLELNPRFMIFSFYFRLADLALYFEVGPKPTIKVNYIIVIRDCDWLNFTN